MCICMLIKLRYWCGVFSNNYKTGSNQSALGPLFSSLYLCSVVLMYAERDGVDNSLIISSAPPLPSWIIVLKKGLSFLSSDSCTLVHVMALEKILKFSAWSCLSLLRSLGSKGEVRGRHWTWTWLQMIVVSLVEPDCVINSFVETIITICSLTLGPPFTYCLLKLNYF